MSIISRTTILSSIVLSTNIAYADDAANAAAPTAMSFIPLIAIFAIFYFFLIRPQVKKQKLHGEMLKVLQPKDKVVTSGGIIGTIVKIEEDSGIVVLEIAKDVQIKILKSTVNEKLTGEEPAKPAVTKKKESKETK